MITALRRLAGIALFAPTLVHLWHRQGEQGWLLALLFAAAALLGRRDPVRTCGAALTLVFLVPLLPVWLGIAPFVTERVVLHGAAAWLLLGGRMTLAPAPGPALRALRLFLLLVAAWSLGSGLRGLLVALPEGSPWTAELIGVALRDLLLPRPQVEPGHSLAALCLRLEFLGAIWVAAELRASRPEFWPRLLGAVRTTLILGFAVACFDLWFGSALRGESFLARLRTAIPRNHRPLLDNNGLGTALVALLPLGVGLLLDSGARWWRERRGALAVLTSLAAVGGGGVLLLTSRSKAALGAFALGLPLLLLAALGLRRTLLRPWIALPLGLALAAAIGAQFLPESLVQRLAAGRYTADAVRVLRLDVATDYLEANRLGPWTAAARAGLDAPWFGAGLGRLPAVFPDYRDAELVTDFNPLHENAHNQWLQSFAEEGAVGVAWLTLLFVGAGYGAWRRVRLDRSREPATDSATLWASAGLATVPVVLAINLQVGHSLLELPVALWVGALLGCAWSAADRPEPALAPSTRRPALAVAATAVIGLLPAWFTPRPALDGFGFGAYPWVARTTTAAGRDRLLTPDARWIEVWGQGSRLVLAVLDPRPLLIPGTMTVTVSIDGREVGTDLPLLRPADATAPLPTTLLKLDPPQPMRAGQRFELRLRTAPAYAETQHGASGRDWIGPRVSAPAFVDPRSR